MSAKIIDGKSIAASIQDRLKTEITLISEGKRPPSLAIILVGDHPASLNYVTNKSKACEAIGITSIIKHLPQDTSQDELTSLVTKLNASPEIDGFMIQLPLPAHINSNAVLNKIAPEKDVDGLNVANMGNLFKAQKTTPYMRPCTPLGIVTLIKHALGSSLKGKHAVVVGQSNIVGKPTAALLLEEDCTVTACHSETIDLPSHIKQGDIVVVAIGCPDFVKGDWFKPSACVIDVGINILGYNESTQKASLTGDVDFESAQDKVSYISPVPGGVGPMTITMLLSNCVEAYKRCYLENER